MAVPADYPPAAIRDGREADVLISCTVSVEGNVKDAVVERSSDSRFDSYALDAARKWYFRPALFQGRPVEFPVKIPMRFRRTRED
ncbi:energy transducer TonB [Geminisphaera colitermitum]|uniref:energy transducer TonB n=1 Tax=Geminisphaera colitermitum TaxID=1148786 RepID=UPI0009E04127